MTELQGKTFLNTRPAHQAAELTSLLKKKGGTVVEFPAVQITPLFETEALREKFKTIDAPDWIVFTSANGVTSAATALSDYLQKREGKVGIAAIGEGTAETLRAHNLPVSFIASESNSEALGEELREHLAALGVATGERLKVLLLRAKEASAALPSLFRAWHAEVIELAVYESNLPSHSSQRITQLANHLGLLGSSAALSPVDMLIFTSSQCARNLVLSLEDTLQNEQGTVWRSRLARIPTAVIGPKTALTTEVLGLNLVLVAREPSIEVLVEDIVRYYRLQT